ncbi:MAG: MotE family protein [Paracoccaceae bacterium]
MSLPARKAPRRRARGRGTLVLIAGLLLASAITRLGNEAGQAFARQPDPAEIADAPSGNPGCEPEEDLAPLLAALQEREDRLVSREAEIAGRMQALALADREITERLARLEAAEESLRATIALADTAAEDDLGRLTVVYENMKPAEAAALFGEMEPVFAAGFLGRMRPEAAAGIMASLPPETAYSISVVLAGRNANAPRE